jgi:hypothetical protein
MAIHAASFDADAARLRRVDAEDDGSTASSNRPDTYLCKTLAISVW